MFARMVTFIVITLGTLASLLSTGIAFAGFDIFDDTVSTTTTINGSSLRIPGVVMARPGQAGQYQASVFASAGNCIRLDVFDQQGVDTEMVVVAPNGTVFRNDDKGGAVCPLCPLVKIGSAPNTGWYTVVIGHFAGAVVEPHVKYLYGLYNGGNPNCASPTPGLQPDLTDPDPGELKPEF